MVQPAKATARVRTLVVDASTLVAELMRERGRALLSRANLEFLVSGRAWEETDRGLRERADILRQRYPEVDVDGLLEAAMAVATARLTLVPDDVYAGHEAIARERIRDETDWPTLALALATGASILTADPDFFGTGVATWTFENLLAELSREEATRTAEATGDSPEWGAQLGADPLPDEGAWASAATEAARETPPDQGVVDRCEDCGMMLPLRFSSSAEARAPCPRCGSLKRAYER